MPDILLPVRTALSESSIGVSYIQKCKDECHTPESPEQILRFEQVRAHNVPPSRKPRCHL